MTFDEVLAALVALIGTRVEIHIFDASRTPHLVASFGGRLEAGHSLTGGEPGEGEAIFVRISAGSEAGSLTIDREVFDAGIRHEDGALTLQLGGVELLVSPRA